MRHVLDTDSVSNLVCHPQARIAATALWSGEKGIATVHGSA